MLKEWCSFELHTVVVDTGESPLEDDEFENEPMLATRNPVDQSFRLPQVVSTTGCRIIGVE
jgi:hypothetical protein